MTLSYDVKDYRTTHFEYPDHTKIHGKPDIDSLVTIFKELKREYRYGEDSANLIVNGKETNPT